MASEMVKFELNLSEPSKELVAYAKENINEDPATRDKILQEFRDLVQEKGEWKSSRVDDQFLLRFLRAKCFNVKEAYQSLVNYQEYKKKYPKYYQNVLFERVRTIADANLIGTLPFYEASGRRILIYRLGQWDPDAISVTELFQSSILCIELGLLEQSTQILGGIVIFDLGGLKMTQVKHMTPKIASRIMDLILYSYPIRIHAIHFVNESPVFKVGYNVAKPFMSKDLKQRIHFHGADMTSFHKHIDPKYLPECYGGIHPEYGFGKWISHLLGNKVALDQLKDLGYDLEEQVRKLGEY